MSKHKFKVGDRVAVYGQVETLSCSFAYGEQGTVIEVFDECVTVTLDKALASGMRSGCVHEKQCRRLVKKPLLRIRVNRNACGWTYDDIDEMARKLSPGEYIEFVEVRKKKK